MGRAILWALGSALAIAAPGCPDPEPRRVVVDRDPDHPLGRADAPALTSPRLSGDQPDRSPESDRGAPSKPGFREISGASYLGHVRLADGDGQWIPDDDDIADLERRLPASARAAKDRGDLPANLDLTPYVRQYRGFVQHHGQRFIEVALYCPESGNLASMDVAITGGGECLVFTAYDPSAGRFLRWTSRAR